jgi:aryl-alcohol dehydrogenase-like predicted oxidoreductase
MSGSQFQFLEKGHLINRLILGTANFGQDYGATNKRGEIPCDEIKAILAQCLALGINQLDTAQAYGRVEEKLGMAGVTHFFTTTKIVLQPEENAETIPAKVEQSMHRLKVDRLDSLLLHNEQRLNQHDAGNVAEELHRLVAKGMVGRVGLSSYEPAQALELCSHYGLQVVQLPANALDRRLFQKGLLDKFLAKGIEVLVRSVFLQGLLLEQPCKEGRIPKEVLDHAGRFREGCRKEGLTPLQGALGSVLGISDKIKIVFGVSHVTELLQVLDACEKAQAPGAFSCPSWQKAFDPRSWAP